MNQLKKRLLNNLIVLTSSASIGELKRINFIVALSGGKDSMTLFDMMSDIQNDIGFKLSAVYINHNLRGEESSSEEMFIKETGKRYGTKINVRKVSSNYWEKRNGRSIEDYARKIRYNYFYKILSRDERAYLITAHHLQDRIETLFIQLMRGGAPETFASIPKRRGRIIRAMFDFKLSEIEQYISENDVKYFTDSTNTETNFLRNKIRHKLIPVIKEIKPHYEKAFEHVFELISEENRYLDNRVLSECPTFEYDKRQVNALDRKKFYACDIFIRKRALKNAIKSLNYPVKLDKSFFREITDEKYQKNKLLITFKNNFKIVSFKNKIWFIKKNKYADNVQKVKDMNDKVVFGRKEISFIDKNQCDYTKSLVIRQVNDFVIRYANENDSLFTGKKDKLIIDMIKDHGYPGELISYVTVFEVNERVCCFFLFDYYAVSIDYYAENGNCIGIIY